MDLNPGLKITPIAKEFAKGLLSLSKKNPGTEISVSHIEVQKLG